MIHIKELFRLQDIQHLRLIAGRDGLERTVTAAVLFEYDPSRVQLPDFYRGDLVVTTLAYARGDAQLVAHSLQALMNQGIASLMVKTAYFSELPQSVREKMFEEAVKVYTRDEIRKDSLVSVRYAEQQNGTCTIGVTIKSEKTGRQKYYLTISASGKEEADRIKKRIQGSPEEFRRYLESYFDE